MYHLELRQSFHNFNHFNVDDGELRALLEPWVRDQAIELGERKWSPHQARLRILEGPQIPLEGLSLGRGWRTAERESRDVTERVIAQAKQAAQPWAVQAASDAGLTPLLGGDPAALLAAWRLTAERRPELAPSESLALAEETLCSLDRSPR
jgi:type VI protein secretion system component VasK